MVTSSTFINTKKIAKKGRPKKIGVLREPNGRVSRSKKSISQHALETRAKKYNLTLEQAADPKAETYLGRLTLIGAEDGLSLEQYEAALKFLKIRNDFKKSVLSKDAYYEGRTLGTDPEMMDDYEKWAKRVRARYQHTLKAVAEAQFDNRKENLYAALQYVIIEKLELPHLLGATRMILNALHRHYAPARPHKNKRIGYYSHSLANIKTADQADLYAKMRDSRKNTKSNSVKNLTT